MKFVIISQYRSGSTMLCRTLNEHPELKVGEEILHKDHEKMVDWRKQIINEKQNANFLNKNFIKSAFQRINGFKIMLTQIEKNSEILEYLKSIKDLKIMLLYRINFLKAFVSLKVALHTNIWQKENSMEKEIFINPININPKEMLENFEKTEKEIQFYKKFFKNHENIEIKYENLIGDWENEFAKIQKFLNVQELCISPQLKKLNHNYKIFIKNYNELKDFFIKTKYKKFFEIQLQ